MKSAPSLLRVLSLAMLGVTALAAVPRARASSNLLDFYVGAGYGHAHLRASVPGLISSLPGSRLGSFDLGHSAYQFTAGIRGLELLGAEVDYFDLGSGEASPSWSGPDILANARVSQKGEAAFGVLYLPVPFIDFYVKAGVARLTTRLGASIAGACPAGYQCPTVCTISGCPSAFSANGALHTTETTFAAGAGVQWQLGAWALRGEYERFGAFGEHPDLLTVGATFSFL